MWRFRILRVFTLFSIAVVVAGCKTSSPLATSAAASAITRQIFTESAVVQSASFASGAVERQPLAIDQYLFSKHWTTCQTETGALASAPTCSLDAEGTSYGRANRWVGTASPACAKCVAWTIPIARANFTSVDSVDMVNASHATVAYSFVVTPNEFGTGLGDWTASHAVAWCGPDPVAVGGWRTPRHASVPFVKNDGAWALANPPGDTFVATFANESPTAKPCAQ